MIMNHSSQFFEHATHGVIAYLDSLLAHDLVDFSFIKATSKATKKQQTGKAKVATRTY